MNMSNKTPGFAKYARKVFLNRVFLIGVSALALYTLVGFLLAPYIIERKLKHYVTVVLNRQIAIERIRVNPYALTLDVSSLALSEADGSRILSFDRFFANFELSSLFKWAWTFAEVRLSLPSLHIDIQPDGLMNLARLLEDASRAEEAGQIVPNEESPQDSPPPRVFFGHIQISEGQVIFTDRSDATPAEATLQSINLDVTNLTTLPERKGPHTFIATLPAGGSIEWTGEVSLHPIASEGKFVLRELKPATAWRFLQDELKLEEPGGTVDIEANYRFNYSKKLAQLTVEPLSVLVTGLSMSIGGSEEPALQIQDIELADGRFDLAKRELTIGNLRVARGNVVIAVNEDGRLNWQDLLVVNSQSTDTSGKESKPFRTTLEALLVEDIAVSYVDKRGAKPVAIDLARLGLRLSASLEQDRGTTQVVANDIDVSLADLALKQIGEPEILFSVNDTAIRGGQFDLAERKVKIDEIVLKAGHAEVWQDAEGKINFGCLFTGDDKGTIKKEVAENQAKERTRTSPWSVFLSSFQIKQSSLRLSDRKLESPQIYKLNNIAMKLTDLRNDPDSSFRVELVTDIEEGGRVTVKGQVNAYEPSMEAKIEATDLALKPLQPYLASIAELSLDSGHFSAKGQMLYGKPEPKATRFSGEIGVGELLLSVPETQKPLLAWKLAKAGGINFSTSPNGLVIDELILEEPSGELLIKEDMSFNIQDVLQPPGRANETELTAQEVVEAKEEPQADGFPIEVKHIKVRHGKLDFADLSLRPQFSAKIYELKGVVVGLSSKPGRRANMELEGRVDEYGSTKLKGEVEVFNAKEFSEIAMSFSNVEMTNLTPYSGKFAGYEIVSGKLSLDLKYKVNNSQLQGDNQIIIDRLTLGERIDSPDALSIPLDLAIALLKDANGRIDIGLPVSGDINDPEFSYTHLIWKALANFLTKIVTAPFKALGALLGLKGGNLDTILFVPGRAELLPRENEKLLSIAEALMKRPQLAVEIQAVYDPKLDGLILRSASVRRELAARSGLTLGPEEDPGPISYTDPVTQQVLESLSTERLSLDTLNELKTKHGMKPAEGETAEKPKTKVKAMAPVSPPDPIGFYKALFGRLVEKETLEENTLKELAQSRAADIIEKLKTAGGLESRRFSVAKSVKAGKADGEFIACKLNLKVAK